VLAGGFGLGAGGAGGGNGNGSAAATTSSASPTVAWAKRRLDRLLADYMLRQGYSTSAALLVSAAAAEAGGSGAGGGGSAGSSSSSAAAAETTTPSPLADLLDWGAFEHAPAVLAALRRRDPAPALAWAAEHRSRLKRLRSPLEFRLRLGEFLELVRVGKREEAVAHARATIAPLLLSGAAGGGGGGGTAPASGGAAVAAAAVRSANAAAATAAGGGGGGSQQPQRQQHQQAGGGAAANGAANDQRDDDDDSDDDDDQQQLERDPLRLLQRAAATLALGPSTRVRRYRRLFSDAAWQDLAALFLEELFRLHGLPAQAPLAAHLQAGLTALKHPTTTSAAQQQPAVPPAAAAAEDAGRSTVRAVVAATRPPRFLTEQPSLMQPPPTQQPVDADGDVAMGEGGAAAGAGGNAQQATNNNNAAAAAAAAALLPPPPSRDDPMSVPELRLLAEALPASKRSRSRLVCRVTRTAMDDHNPPLVLPNGYVYSSRGVDALVALHAQRRAAGHVAEAEGAAAGGGAGGGGGGANNNATNGDGSETLMCPMTGQVFRRSQLRRAYIV
jgi:hypothetical protein